ncbi:MAG: FecR domain-containing protein [Bryobacteraceae bacterium]|jgi:ferric-dicitrate binding protein FerR (iron transport regulator)
MTENNPMDTALEQAVSEICDETIDDAVIEAAAARVWARLAEAAPHKSADHIRGCADFQSLIPEYRAGRLTEARALLLQDHLHQCVACRHVFEGKVVTLRAPGPGGTPARRTVYPVRWAVAAVFVAAAGLSIWVAVDQFGGRTGRAIVQTATGTLYEITPAGIRVLAAGQELPDGVEIRTAKDSDAMLQLRDGSVVELRERSGYSAAQAGNDLTIHLDRGSIIVEAARRRSGHLFVATADCRVAVTGTVFSVSAGVKGSRVSVIQGEVRVTEDNQEKVLHPGEQAVTNASLEPLSVRDDISWSRNRDRLLKQLDALRTSLEKVHLPDLRYSSRLLGRLPASTAFLVSIPNLAQYLGEVQTTFQQNLPDSPELRRWWAGSGFKAEPLIEKLRAASEYLGEEIIVTAFAGPDGKILGPVVFAEVKREGFPEFLKRQGLPLSIETRAGLVAFGPPGGAVAAFAAELDSPSGGFQSTPFYARIAQSYREGAGLLLCADLGRLPSPRQANGVRYIIAEQKEVNHQMEARAAVGFDGPRTGIAAWLAEPSPMGALDYVSPDATLVTAFVVKNPADIVDQTLALQQRSPAAAEKALADARQQTGFDVRGDLAASLGGEFAVVLDGPAFPVPSWKLVAEVYDPGRFEATVQKVIEAYNREAAKSGDKPLRTSQEVADGHTFYMIAGGVPNPLTEAHYTFAGGYLIAAPTRALVARALQVKAAGTSIARSAKFLSMAPRDGHVNFSALIYQNLGTTLAPLAGLLDAFGRGGRGRQMPLQDLGNFKPSLIAAYGEPDRITIASNKNVLGKSVTDLLSGNLLGIAGSALPFSQLQGTRRPQPAFR